ncbi:MAG: PaaI family thioesterase [Candidatus Acidiferrales bacterium]
MLLEPKADNSCFACGGANAHGMHLTFEQDDDAKRIRGAFRLPGEYQGGAGFVHGGIVATLLDEAMAKVSRFAQDHAVTAKLNIEYLRPVPVDADLIVEGWELERNGRDRFRQGEIRSASGVVLARGRGHFVEIGRERFQESIRSVNSAPADSDHGKF